jgi:autophagy-related protein 101
MCEADSQRSGILHTIFFHRFFPSIRPKTRDVLDLTLPFVDDVELETLIDQRTATLVRQLDTSSDMGARNTGVRGLMTVQFFEKKRRKAWFTKGEEEVCWEQWTLDVTLATPRTESGMCFEAFFFFVKRFLIQQRLQNEHRLGKLWRPCS